MDFEFDPVKSLANADKHGIDFEAAQVIWSEGDPIEFRTGVYGDEARSIIVGEIAGRYWTAVITYRSNCIRIISVRRSRDREREAHQRRGV